MRGFTRTFVLVVCAFPAVTPFPSSAQQNLLDNGGFRTDVSGWTAASSASAVWSNLDASAATASGSMLVTARTTSSSIITGVTQCVAVSPGQQYFLSMKTRMPSGQQVPGTAYGIAQFNSESGCKSDHYIASPSLWLKAGETPGGPLDSWETVSGTVTSPPDARSVLIECSLQKRAASSSDVPLLAYFDDVLFFATFGTVPRTLVVPSAASVHGQNQTFFHTDLWIRNRSYENVVAVAMTYRCQAGFTCADGSYSFTLAPRHSLLLTDVVANAFRRPETAGAVDLTWDSAVASISAHSRTYTPSLPDPTNGTSVPAVDAGSATGRALFLGLGNNGGSTTAGFRSNAGAYNRTETAASVTFRLLDASGALLGETVRTAGPGQPFQINDVFAAVGAGSVVTSNASLEVTSTVPVHPFVTVIDNKSGDSVWVPPSPDEAP